LGGDPYALLESVTRKRSALLANEHIRIQTAICPESEFTNKLDRRHQRRRNGRRAIRRDEYGFEQFPVLSVEEMISSAPSALKLSALSDLPNQRQFAFGRLLRLSGLNLPVL
jgi:hypothetical protein